MVKGLTVKAPCVELVFRLLGDVLELSNCAGVGGGDWRGRVGADGGDARQSAVQSSKLVTRDRDECSTFDDIVGHIGPDSEMVMILPIGDSLPEPDLLQELVALLVKVGCLLRFGHDIFFNPGQAGCFAGGECFAGASDVYSEPLECCADAEVALGLLAFTDGEPFLRNDGEGVVAAGFVHPLKFKNSFEPLRPCVQPFDQVLCVVGENHAGTPLDDYVVDPVDLEVYEIIQRYLAHFIQFARRTAFARDIREFGVTCYVSDLDIGFILGFILMCMMSCGVIG